MSAVVYRHCPKCRGERQVDGETFRCHECGTQTKYVSPSQTVVPPNDTAPAPNATVTLPSNTNSRKWVEQTRALADAFAKAAKEAESRATLATAEAERLRRAAGAFLGLLKQVNLEDAPVETAASRKNGRWSQQFDACTDCGTTEKRHMARGLCTSCYSKRSRSAA